MITAKKMFFLVLSFILVVAWNANCEEGVAESGEAQERSVKPPSKPEDEKPKVVVKVNEAEIDELDVLGMVNTMIPGAMVHGSVSDEKQKDIRRKALTRLITNELEAQDAIKEGIKVSKKDVDKEIKELRKKYRKQKTTLEDVLKKSKFSMEELRKEIEKDLSKISIREMKNKEFKEKSAEIWTDASLEGYYNGNKEKFQIPEAVRLSNILIKADPGGGQDAWEKARVRSEEILNKIKEGGIFAELAKEFSEDIYASKGGDMGLGHQGTIIPEIEEVANKLSVGEVAGPVWTIYGFHIIKLEEKVPPVQLTFDQVKDNLKRDRESYEIKKGHSLWIHRLWKVAKIEYMNEEDSRLMGATGSKKEPEQESKEETNENKNKDNNK